MALSINIANLASRVARTNISPSGIRRFAVNASMTQNPTGGGLPGKLWAGFSRFGGFLISGVIAALNVVAFSLRAMWGFCVSLFQFVWNFNWNATDTELDDTIKASFNALGGTVGGTLGNALGYLACGAVPGALVAVFNEPLGLHILQEVSETAVDEIASNLANLITQSSQLLIKSAVVFLYKNTRVMFRDSGDMLRAKLVAEGKVNAADIEKAVATRNKPWSFSSAFQEKVESIPVPFIKNFVEEFVEEFSDSCIEAGYVVAGASDSFLAANQTATNAYNGGTTTITISPVRSAATPATP